MRAPEGNVLIASLLTVASVVLGAVLGLWGRGERALGRLRALALGAAFAVVAFQLLPEAAVRLGPAALLATALGFALPTAFERLELGRRFGGAKASDGRIGLELGFVGLLVHQLGDGLGMGAFTGPGHDDHLHLEVFLTVGAHTVPIIAVMAAAFARLGGVGPALVRAGLLALASVVGVVLAGSTFAAVIGPHHALVSAIVGGLLLHVVVHGLDEVPVRGIGERALEVGLVAVGVVSVLASAADHGHDGAAPVLGEVTAALDRHASLLAVPLFVGLIVAYLIEISSRSASGASRRSPVEGAVVGALLLGPAWGAAIALGWALGGFRSRAALELGEHDDEHAHDHGATAAPGSRLVPLLRRGTQVLPAVVFSLAMCVSLDIARMDAPFGRGASLLVALGLALLGGRSVAAAVPVALVAAGRGAEVPILVAGLAAGPALASVGHAILLQRKDAALEALAWAFVSAAGCFALASWFGVRWSPAVATPLLQWQLALSALGVLFVAGALWRGTSALMPAWAVHHHGGHAPHASTEAGRTPETSASPDP